jgi:hypothetical protein
MSTLEHSRVFCWLVDIHRAEAHRFLRLDPVPMPIYAMALLAGESRVGTQMVCIKLVHYLPGRPSSWVPILFQLHSMNAIAGF